MTTYVHSPLRSTLGNFSAGLEDSLAAGTNHTASTETWGAGVFSSH